MNRITLALLNKETAKPLRTLDITLDDYNHKGAFLVRVYEWLESISDEKLACEDEEKALEYENLDLKTIALIDHDLRHYHACYNQKLYLRQTETTPDVYIKVFDSKAYYEYVDAIDAANISNDALDAGLDIGFDVTDAIENYYGKYESHAEFAQELYESMGTELGSLDDYIDWGRVGSDLVISDFSECDGHYFHN